MQSRLESGRKPRILLDDHRRIPQFIAVRLIHHIGKWAFHDAGIAPRRLRVRNEDSSRYRRQGHP